MILNIPIKSIMTKELITVRPDTSFSKIKTMFECISIHHILVTDKDQKLQGIISKTDWLDRLILMMNESSGRVWNQKHLSGLKAKNMMRRSPITLSPNDEVATVASLILENKFHAVPIVQNNIVVGIVTSHDLIATAYYKDPVGQQV